MAQQDLERQPKGSEGAELLIRAARWAQERRALLRKVGLGFSVLIIAVSTVIFARTVLGIDPHRFEAAFASIGADQLAMSFGLACVSYLALTGYDGWRSRICTSACPIG